MTEFDNVLFGPSDHPEEPISEGASWGPGSNFLRNGPETEQEFKQRIARQLANAPAATPRVRAFAARVARGE